MGFSASEEMWLQLATMLYILSIVLNNNIYIYNYLSNQNYFSLQTVTIVIILYYNNMNILLFAEKRAWKIQKIAYLINDSRCNKFLNRDTTFL